MRFYLSFFFVSFLCCCEENIVQGDLFLPYGFSSTVFVVSLSQNIRHITVNENGDLYAKYKSLKDDNSLAAIRDINNDGKADKIFNFGKFKIKSNESDFEWAGLLETGARVRNGYLYYSSELVVYRVIG